MWWELCEAATSWVLQGELKQLQCLPSVSQRNECSQARSHPRDWL